MKYLKGFARFLYDFYVGDDWKTAAGVVGILGIAAVLVATGALGETAIALIVAASISLAFAANLIVDVRSRDSEGAQHELSPPPTTKPAGSQPSRHSLRSSSPTGAHDDIE